MLLLLGILLGMGTTSPASCLDNDNYRQFDFWLGSWDVYNADRELVGTNDITSAEEGCVLIEKWRGRQGSTGMSINYFEPASGLWKQAWVAASGYIVELSGRFDGASMAMEGTLINADGTSTPMRGRWTPLEDGRVRQQFHIADSTQAWQTWFDGYYERRSEQR